MQNTSSDLQRNDQGSQYKAPEVSKLLFAEVYDLMKAQPALETAASRVNASGGSADYLIFQNISSAYNTNPPARLSSGESNPERPRSADTREQTISVSEKSTPENATTVDIIDLQQMTERARLSQRYQLTAADDKAAESQRAAYAARLADLPQLAIEAAQTGAAAVNVLKLTDSADVGVPRLSSEQQKIYDAIKVMGFNPTIEKSFDGLNQLNSTKADTEGKPQGGYYLRAEW